MKQILLALGQRVKELRAKRGFSQEGFADHCGLHRTTISLIERGDSEGLPLKPFASSRIILQFLRQKLQRDIPAELEVFRLVDHTHTAATEPLRSEERRVGKEGQSRHRQ